MAIRSASTGAAGAASSGLVRQAPATHGALIGAGAALTFVVTCLFRFLSAEFTNDHFMHLV